MVLSMAVITALYLGMSFAIRDHKIFNLKMLMLTQNFLKACDLENARRVTFSTKFLEGDLVQEMMQS